MPTTQPSVAVCVPAYGAPDALADLLAALDALAWPVASLQVVVAVDGPDPDLEKVAEDAGATVVVLPVNGGSYAARNAALDALRDDITVVLFTDLDCAPEPAWVEAHVTALTSSPASGGAVRFTMGDPPRPAEWVDAHRHLRQRHFVENLGFAATCNLGVRREVVDALRFDSSLRSGGDFDFGRRLAAAGHSIAYTPEAVVQHPARATSREVLKKVARVAKGAARNQERGHAAVRRRDPARGSALVAASSLPAGRWWRARVALLDAACSLVYARHVPSVVMPALRRRLSRVA